MNDECKPIFATPTINLFPLKPTIQARLFKEKYLVWTGDMSDIALQLC